MHKRDSEENRSVALYWDFENLHAALCEARQEGAYGKQDNRFKVQDPLVDVQAVVEMAVSYGPIAINRAYCNWQFFGRYRDALLQSAVELIQLFPPGASAKNGADIRLCLDAAEDIGRFAHIGTVIIVGGDSDFMPVSQKIKAAGRTLIGVGARKSTNRHWARSCHEFRYYESLVDTAADAPATLSEPGQVQASSPAVPEPVDAAVALFKRAMRLLEEASGDSWINKALIWPMIKRLDPTFDPTEHGYTSFRAMVKTLDPLIELRESALGHAVRLRSENVI